VLNVQEDLDDETLDDYMDRNAGHDGVAGFTGNEPGHAAAGCAATATAGAAADAATAPAATTGTAAAAATAAAADAATAGAAAANRPATYAAAAAIHAAEHVAATIDLRAGGRSDDFDGSNHVA
jgi:hypothetical protein